MSPRLPCFELERLPGVTGEQLAVRDTVSRFVEREIAPHAAEWDEAEGFPRELYRRAAAIGLLGLGYPEALGGTPCDAFARVAASLELGRAGAGGVGASLMSHTIMLPPLLEGARPEILRAVAPALLSGRAIGALAVTEPSGGSDVAALRTRAEPAPGGFRLHGEKTYITSGLRADWILVAARLHDGATAPAAMPDPASASARRSGISLFLLDGEARGLSRTALRKTGWWASDTATLHLDGCFVPTERLVGPVHGGFPLVMRNFNAERLTLAATAVGAAITCCEDARDWARQRQAFGAPLIAQQVVRHKLVAMVEGVLPMLAWLQALAARIDAAGGDARACAADIALAKNRAARLMRDCAGEAVQVLGGMGFMRGSRVERIWRDTKVMMIGGGAEDVLADLAARQLEL